MEVMKKQKLEGYTRVFFVLILTTLQVQAQS